MTIPIYGNKEVKIKVTKQKKVSGKTPLPQNIQIQRQQGGEERERLCFSQTPDRQRGNLAQQWILNLLTRVR